MCGCEWPLFQGLGFGGVGMCGHVWHWLQGIGFTVWWRRYVRPQVAMGLALRVYVVVA